MVEVYKIVKSNMERMCMSFYFGLAILMNLLLMVFGYIYTDMSSEKAYSLFTFIFMKNPEVIMQQGELSWGTTYLMESPGYIWMFAPVIVTLPFIATMCAGNSYSNTRLEMVRTSKKKYILGRIIASLLVAGIIMMIAQIIYGGICYLVMGNTYVSRDTLLRICEECGLLGKSNISFKIICVYIFRTLSAFLYGLSSAIPVILLSYLIRNKYLVFSISFMYNYFFYMFLNNQLIKIINNDKIVSKINSIFLKTNLQSIYLIKRNLVLIIILWLLVEFLMTYKIHYFITERRCDCCER